MQLRIAQFLSIALMIKHTIEQTPETMSQYTKILDYDSTFMKDQTGHSEIHFSKQPNSLQYTKDDLYYLFRRTDLDNNYFVFGKKNFATWTTAAQVNLPQANTLWYFPGHRVYGFMNGGADVLDFVVAYYPRDNELRVISCDGVTDPALGVAKHHKSVTLNYPLEGEIYSASRMVQTTPDPNQYETFMLGKYIDPTVAYDLNADPPVEPVYNMYFAKFSTLYNITEYYYESKASDVSEIPRQILINEMVQQVHCALEINKNSYFGTTTYEPDHMQTPDTKNVAIVSMDFNYGTRRWAHALGETEFDDEFVSMSQYGNRLFVLMNSWSDSISSAEPKKKDLLLYSLLPDNGYIKAKKFFGSPDEDVALDMIINHIGVFIYAEIGTGLIPHRTNGKYWATQNGARDLALIFVSFDLDIIDIESYDLTDTVNLPPNGPKPLKMIAPEQNGEKYGIYFVSHRDDEHTSGAYWTMYEDSSLLFTKSCSINNCVQCGFKFNEICFECDASKLLIDHKCYDTCPEYSFADPDGLELCRPCHFSCQGCNSGTLNDCNDCCDEIQCENLDKRTLDAASGLCKCTDPTKIESNELCVDNCNLGLRGKEGDKCYLQCPSSSYDFVDLSQLTAQPRSHYDSEGTSGDCSDVLEHLKFHGNPQSAGDKGILQLQLPLDTTAPMPKELTFAFWMYIGETANQKHTVAKIIDNFAVEFEITAPTVIAANFNIRNDGTSIYQKEASTPIKNNIWIYATASFRYLNSQIEGTFVTAERFSVATQTQDSISDAPYSRSMPANFADFTNLFVVGGSVENNWVGAIKEVRYFNKYHSTNQLIQDRDRVYASYSYDDPYLLAYWKFNETASTGSYTLYDYSQSSATLDVTVVAGTTPTLESDNSFALNLCYYHDVSICESVDYSLGKMAKVFTSGAKLSRHDLFTIQEDGSFTFQDNDVVGFYEAKKECGDGDPISRMIRRGTAFDDDTPSVLELPDGKHYKVCYKKVQNTYWIPLAQIYIAKMISYIYPYNAATYFSAGIEQEFTVVGDDQSFGDQVLFAGNCEDADGTEPKINRLTTGLYENLDVSLFVDPAKFEICWRPKFVDESIVDYYESINGFTWTISAKPSITGSPASALDLNTRYLVMDLLGATIDSDRFAWSHRGAPQADCVVANLKGDFYHQNYNQVPPFWFGSKTHTYGMLDDQNIMHLCWRSSAFKSSPVWERVSKSDGSAFEVTLSNHENLGSNLHHQFPEIQLFTPKYGGSISSNDNLSFQFEGSNTVYPSGVVQNLSQIPGKIQIRRAAIDELGEIQDTNQILWVKDDLEDSALKSGDLECDADGACIVKISDNTQSLVPGEVYYLEMYTGSFVKKDTANNAKYYLFGDDDNVQMVYKHLFFCRGWDITQLLDKVGTDPTQLILTGTNLLYQDNILLKHRPTADVDQHLFTTKSVNITFTVEDNIICTVLPPPTGSVRIQDVENDKITISDFNLHGCEFGTLYADIKIVRGIKEVGNNRFDHEHTTVMEHVRLGEIACESDCLTCYGGAEKECVVCTDYENSYSYNGQCYQECPPEAPYYEIFEEIYKNERYYAKKCVAKCQDGFFPDLRDETQTKPCQECNNGCQECDQNDIGGCSICAPVQFLYEREEGKGICLDMTDCPTDFYELDYKDYKCKKTEYFPPASACAGTEPSSSYLNVKIQSLGYLRQIPKDLQAFLRVDIDNKRGIITPSDIQWEQIEPAVDVSISDQKQQYAFKESSTGVFDNTGASVKIRMSAFNYVPPTQRYKVKVEVTNTCGDKAFDFYEWFLNDPPKAKDLDITPNTDVVMHTSALTLTALNNWYDSLSDVTSKLRYKVVAERLSDGKVYLLSTLQTETTTTLNMPVLAADNSAAMDIKLYLYAQDKHQSLSFKSQTLSVTNAYDGTETQRATIIGELESRDYTLSTTLLTTAASLEFLEQAPRRYAPSEGICTSAYQCFNHGECSFAWGYSRCFCTFGYGGNDCQFTLNEKYLLESINTKMITALKEKYDVMEPEQFINNDIEYISYVLKGALKHPDMFPSQYITDASTLLWKASQAEIQSIWTLRKPEWKAFLDACGRLIAKIHYEEKLGDVRSLHENYPGVQRNEIPDLKEQDREVLKGNLNKLYEAVTTLLKIVTRKLDAITTKFEYVNDYLEIRLKRHTVDEVLDLPFTFKLKEWEEDLEVLLDADCFDGITNLFPKNEANVEIKFMAIKWKTHPFLHDASGHLVETDALTFEVFDNNGTKFPIVDRVTPIQIKLPYDRSLRYDLEFLRCKVWDKDPVTLEYSFIDDSCSVRIVPAFESPEICSGCTQINSQIALIQTKHLSTFAGVFDKAALAKGHYASLGIYTNFYAMQYWMQSFGFIAVIGCASTYIIGLIFFLICDRKPKKRLIGRLERDFAGIEKYGMDPQNEKDVGAPPKEEEKEEQDNDNKQKKGKKPMKGKKLRSENVVVPFGDDMDKTNTTQTNLETSVIENKPLAQKDKMDVEQTASSSEGDGKKKSKLKAKKIKDNEADEIAEEVKDGNKSKRSTGTNFKKKKQPPQPLEIEEEYKDDPKKPGKKGKKKKGDDFDDLGKAKNEEELYGKTKFENEDMEINKRKLITEQERFAFKYLLIHGNSLLNLIFVPSILFPRHARWTLAYTNIVLVWFICGVFYNNTKDPLEIPDFNTEAKFQALEDLWVAFISPFAVIIMMYIFSGLFRMTDQRIKNSDSLPMFREMMIELRKEMLLRFVMAYFIIFAVFGSVFWYVIKFTATFGWKVSWAWWWTGCISAFCNFVIYDLIFTIIHYLVYRCNRTFGILVEKVRSVKQGWSEG